MSRPKAMSSESALNRVLRDILFLPFDGFRRLDLLLPHRRKAKATAHLQVRGLGRRPDYEVLKTKTGRPIYTRLIDQTSFSGSRTTQDGSSHSDNDSQRLVVLVPGGGMNA